MRDYGKVHTSFWSSATIRSMSEDGRALSLYLLTSPHGTICGVMRLPDGYVCEDLQWSHERVLEGFKELFQKGFAYRCETTKWVWIQKHFKWNPLENPNQKKSARKVSTTVPDECKWKPLFLNEVAEYLGLEKPNPSQTLPEPFLNQEQEQEQEQYNKTIDQSTRENRVSEIDREFAEKFWPAYPRKVSKGQAEKAFRSARKKASLEEIVAGVERYAKARAGQDPQYTKHPSVWLNAKAWLDEPDRALLAITSSDDEIYRGVL